MVGQKLHHVRYFIEGYKSQIAVLEAALSEFFDSPTTPLYHRTPYHNAKYDPIKKYPDVTRNGKTNKFIVLSRSNSKFWFLLSKEIYGLARELPRDALVKGMEGGVILEYSDKKGVEPILGVSVTYRESSKYAKIILSELESMIELAEEGGVVVNKSKVR